MSIPSNSQKLEIIQSLIERENIREDAINSFQKLYPDTDNSFLETAVFHIYIDGIKAAIDWLIDAEYFLRNSTDSIDRGKTFHLIYHLYNWLQIQEILPHGKQGLLDKSFDIKEAIKDNDIDAALDLIQELEEMLNGNQNPPDFLNV